MVTSLVRLVDYLVNNYLAESSRFFNFFALNIMANRGARACARLLQSIAERAGASFFRSLKTNAGPKWTGIRYFDKNVERCGEKGD